MPVIRGRDFNRINILAAENLAKVFNRITTLVLAAGFVLGVVLLHDPFRGFASGDLAAPVSRTLPVRIANRNHLHAFITKEPAHVVRALIPHPNKRHGDSIGRCHGTVQSQRTWKK